jgi:transcriptional regulator with XRE-family HTH domain
MRAAQIRKAKGLSQEDLADLSGVEQPTISRFERGSDGITLRIIRQIADALDVSVSDLFGDERNEIEDVLIQAYRKMPPERQQGWADLAQVLAHPDK